MWLKIFAETNWFHVLFMNWRGIVYNNNDRIEIQFIGCDLFGVYLTVLKVFLNILTNIMLTKKY